MNLPIDKTASRILISSLVAFILFTVIGVVFATQNWIVGGPGGRFAWPNNIMVSMAQWWIWAAFAPVILALTAHPPIAVRRSRWRQFCFHAVLCLAAMILHILLVAAIERGLERVTANEDMLTTIRNLALKRSGVNLLTFFVLLMIGHAASLRADRQRQDRELERRNAELAGMRQAGKSAEIAVRGRNGIALLKSDEIDWVEAAGNYAIIHVGDATHMMRTTLDELLERLGDGFVRVNRSALVNLAQVTALSDRSTQGDLTLCLQAGHTVRLTRTYRRSIMDALPKAQ